MKRFQWKVVALMLLVSAIPLIVSALVADRLLEDTVAIGFDARLEGGLEAAVETHRRYIQVRRRAVVLETRDLAHDPSFLALLDADPPAPAALQTWLAAWIEQVSDPHMDVAMIELRPADGAQTPPLRLDRRDKFPEDRWRTKAQGAIARTERGARFELTVTYVVPWALFREFEDLGHLGRTFDQLERRQASLTTGYTRTLVAFSGAVLAVTFLAGFLWSRATTSRLGRLARATEQVGRGNLDVQVPVQGRDEIAQLTEAFNRMVAEIRQSRDRLAYLERVSTWQEIARRLAHEITNPLTPILLAVQQLDRKFEDYQDQPERYRRLVSDSMEIVSEEVESLRKLVREFSDFARLPRVDPEPTDVERFLRELIRTNPQFAPHVAAPDDLDESLDPGSESDREPHEGRARAAAAGDPLTAGVDATMMRRALLNLVENAQQAIDRAGLPAEGAITLRVERGDPGSVRIVVEDRGPGVAPEHLGSLFDPYFTTKSDGTGLGLAIVKKIVLDHGGDIIVESPLDERGGTRFTLTLPRA